MRERILYSYSAEVSVWRIHSVQTCSTHNTYMCSVSVETGRGDKKTLIGYTAVIYIRRTLSFPADCDPYMFEYRPYYCHKILMTTGIRRPNNIAVFVAVFAYIPQCIHAYTLNCFLGPGGRDR